LKVKDLSVSFQTRDDEFEAVRNVSFDVKRGETIGIVGESGSGKSVTAKTIMRLLASPPSIMKSGSIEFLQEDLTKKTEKEMESIRGKEIGMIFQDPMTSLNPRIRIGKQISESLIKHQRLSKKNAEKQAMEIIRLVGFQIRKNRYFHYPHDFQGGFRKLSMTLIPLL